MPDECMTEGVDLFPDAARQRLIADDPGTLLAFRLPWNALTSLYCTLLRRHAGKSLHVR